MPRAVIIDKTIGWMDIHFLLEVISKAFGFEGLNFLRNGSIFPRNALLGK